MSNNDLNFIPETIKQSSQALPETTKAIDNALSSIANIFNTIATPFNIANLYANHSLQKTKLILNERLKNIPPEKIIVPPSYISIPTIQAITYTADSDELHKMFASLLATSMNADTQTMAHPSFVEIIKQLSPLEAKIISNSNIRSKPEFPLCSVRLQKPPNPLLKLPLPYPMAPASEGNIVLNKLTILDGFESINLRTISSSLDNLERLGIIYLPNGFIVDKEAYSKIYKSINHIKQELNIQELEDSYECFSSGYKFALVPHAGIFSDFGKTFVKACL